MVLDTATKPSDKTQKPKDETPKAKETTQKTQEPTPKTFTQEQLDKEKETAVHDALMKRGRDWKTLELERDSLSSQLKEQKSSSDKLQMQLDELANENPDKFNVVKKFRELDEWEKKLNATQSEHETKIRQEREAIEAEKATHQQVLKSALETQREIDVFDISEEFEGGDATKLKELTAIIGATSKEQIRKVAETLWKLKTAKEEEPLKLDSGITVGGLTEEIIRKNFREHPEDPKARSDYYVWRRKKGI